MKQNKRIEKWLRDWEIMKLLLKSVNKLQSIDDLRNAILLL